MAVVTAQKGKEGLLLFYSSVFVKSYNKDVFVHYMCNTQMERTGGKRECFQVLGFSHQEGAFWGVDGGGFQVALAFPAVVTVADEGGQLPPIRGTQRETLPKSTSC